MRLVFKNKEIESITHEILDSYKATYEENMKDDQFATINLIKIKKDKAMDLIPILENKTNENFSKQIMYILLHYKTLENPFIPIYNTQHCELVVIGYLAMSKNYRMYIKDKMNEKIYGYRVVKISYTASRNVLIELVFNKHGKYCKREIILSSSMIKGKTVEELFNKLRYYIENQSIRNKYLEDKEKYEKIYNQIGKQFTLSGISKTELKYSEYDQIKYYKCLHLKSENHKVIIDVEDESDSVSSRDIDNEDVKLGLRFWKQHSKLFSTSLLENQNEKTDNDIDIPIDPEVIYFDLKRHKRLSSHPDFLTQYQYQDDLEKDLIMADYNKKMIRSLVTHSNYEFNDIVHGKSGGMLIMLSGGAGVGKTLTAEIFSETMRKPLYIVQSSQLGIKPNEIENNLEIIFKRSMRWDSILLIDEADVYVHKRTTNLEQNAVVGVFLRTLEYYPVITFMTTNRPDIIDDAIISRCIVVMQYPTPTIDEQKRIWNVLLKNTDIQIDKLIIDQITQKISLTGRDIKNVIKLLKIQSIKNEIKFDDIESLCDLIPNTNKSKIKIETVVEVNPIK